MRVHINLATRPYEDAKEFWARWGVGVGALGLVTLLLLGFAIRGWVNAGRDRHNIRTLQQQIAERDDERAKAQSYLDMPANRSTRDQSQFLNGLIQRKSFSWTRVFEDLEKVMPNTLHVVSLKPDLNDQNQLQLEMKVAGDSRAAAIELFHRMEASPHFQGTQMTQEGTQNDNGAGIAADIIAVYVPETANKGGK